MTVAAAAKHTFGWVKIHSGNQIVSPTRIVHFFKIEKNNRELLYFIQFDKICIFSQTSDENLKIFAHRNACSVCSKRHVTKFKQFTYLWLWSDLFTEILYAIQINSIQCPTCISIHNAAFIHCVLCKFPTCQNQEQSSSTHFHNIVCSRSAFIPLYVVYCEYIVIFKSIKILC